ncbi:MAG: Lrp/AsnC family transcriptional regulator [Caulobacteraceae bacterium]|nr:Lrp/AsnC family transcriptional regulator [Caulobacteraceae bacterium]
MEPMDAFDLKILAEVQRDGAITHAQLADRVHLSPSQCSRRLQRLESLGVIDHYAAMLSREKLGLGVTAYVMITMRAHSQANLEDFRARMLAIPEVLECCKITGDADYLVKVISTDLARYDQILTEQLMRAPEVAVVRSSIVLQALKQTSQLPLPAPDGSRPG